MSGEPLSALGGRKFALALIAIGAIVGCAVMKADPASFTAIASVAIAFAAGNAYVTGKYAGPK
ncbi:MAG TPA: hypothetical protein VFM71_01475 [Gemmatimonadaceae bacterium]|nr:hypothetical protein [Gemmatimonadaceae bacterium]